MPEDALNEIRAKARQAHERLLKIVDDLSDEQLAWRPAPKAHSIGFTFWHVARADDNVQADVKGTDAIWNTDEYAVKWGHPVNGIGVGWDDEAAAALPLPPKAELVGYARRVFDAVDAATALDAGRFTEKRQSRFLSREATLGDIVFTGITHDSRHLGEMEYIKGLLGLRGSVTV